MSLCVLCCRQVSLEEGDSKARELSVNFIETSAKAGFNIKVGTQHRQWAGARCRGGHMILGGWPTTQQRPLHAACYPSCCVRAAGRHLELQTQLYRGFWLCWVTWHRCGVSRQTLERAAAADNQLQHDLPTWAVLPASDSDVCVRICCVVRRRCFARLQLHCRVWRMQWQTSKRSWSMCSSHQPRSA